ncbi:coilin-like isoform X2 [Juglans microcarpa x Juglans regia]|uniref:coilin-like isoform X2 n=1 Tax=Juglans microcarpa x Juglans regia TaxID=2249226 RepID=UPI001B7F5D04|nr:coilin-like isoform X2 [Juglans microcarpa x Juglans regia]
MESVRVRLDFKHRDVLNKSQLMEGLMRSWLLLKPEMETISGLAAYLLHTFDLYDSCPRGLILSMDGFVLPPFESTCILKDKDIVCVKRKGDSVVDTIQAGEGLDSLEVDENVEKQSLLEGLKLLANEEFEKEHNENDDSVQEYMVTRKRKASKKLQGSRRKKNKVATTGKCSVVLEDDQKDIHAEENGSLHQCGVLPKKSVKKDKLFRLPVEQDKSSVPESDKRSNDTTKSAPSAKRFCQLEENGEESVDASHKPCETKKIPSRSARRKKAKRLWLREQDNAEKKKLHQGQTLKRDDEQSPVKDNQKLFEEPQQPDENSEEEDEVVPVVIRPGHIRFERLDKVRDVQQYQTPMESLQWNGITSKRKGQKWGLEKVAYYKRNDHVSSNEEIAEMVTAEEAPAKNPTDFDKLKPYTSSPKKGDVVAYRLIELSSSWTPELSSFRVGKISWYNPESNWILLVTVPEYPIDFEKITEEPSAAQPDTSLYGEDGSLKINYSSLVDIRIVKYGNLDTTEVTGEVIEVPAGNQIPVSCVAASTPVQAPIPARENGEVNAWDEIGQALNAKKVQLSEEDGWRKEESSGKSGWSYRALRSSALGPTMARLRAQNGL